MRLPTIFPTTRNLFETYGFQTYFKQEGFHLDITEPLPPRFQKIAEWVSRKPDYEFRHFEWKKTDKYMEDFVTVFNEAWASFKENFEPLEVTYIKKTLQKAKAIIDEEFIWIAYNKGKPIAIYLMYPDVNQILKHLNGRLTLAGHAEIPLPEKEEDHDPGQGRFNGCDPCFPGHGCGSRHHPATGQGI